MKKKRILAAIVVAVSVSIAAIASPVSDFNDITTWVGTGTKQAALIIDFNDGSTDESFVWGYRWDGTQTGEDMFHAIVAADPNLMAEIPSSFYLKNTTYNDGSVSHTSVNGSNIEQYGSTDEWWKYFTADGSTGFPASWTESGVGAQSRVLANNSWDGWSATTDQDFSGATGPGSPINASTVPEPSAAFLLIAGIGLLTWVRKATSSKA